MTPGTPRPPTLRAGTGPTPRSSSNSPALRRIDPTNIPQLSAISVRVNIGWRREGGAGGMATDSGARRQGLLRPRRGGVVPGVRDEAEHTHEESRRGPHEEESSKRELPAARGRPRPAGSRQKDDDRDRGRPTELPVHVVQDDGKQSKGEDGQRCPEIPTGDPRPSEAVAPSLLRRLWVFRHSESLATSSRSRSLSFLTC
jgi:hypothetical protein